jgi:hypothetical protein
METIQSSFNFGFVPTKASNRKAEGFSNTYFPPVVMVNNISDKGDVVQEIRVSKAFIKTWGIENNSINYAFLDGKCYIIVLPENDGVSLKRTNKGKPNADGLNTKSPNFKAPYLVHFMYQAGLLPEATSITVEDAQLTTYEWDTKVKVPMTVTLMTDENGNPSTYGNSLYILEVSPDTTVENKDEDEDDDAVSTIAYSSDEDEDEDEDQ